jgi:hypothetical protein
MHKIENHLYILVHIPADGASFLKNHGIYYIVGKILTKRQLSLASDFFTKSF